MDKRERNTLRQTSRGVWLPLPTWVRIKRACSDYMRQTGEGMSQNEYVRRAVTEKLDRETSPVVVPMGDDES